MRIGYARVFLPETKILIFNLMLYGRLAAPTPNIYKEEISGVTREWPQLQKLREQLREGDVVIV